MESAFSNHWYFYRFRSLLTTPQNLGSLENGFGEKYKFLFDKATIGSVYFVDFELLRDGTLTIFSDDETYPKKIKFSESFRKSVLPKQLYFFMKDICHIHQHHSPSIDTMTNLHKVGNNGSTEIDDILWRYETLSSFYRMALQYKRTMNLEKFDISLGVLAYAKTFNEISKQTVGKEIFPHFQHENLKESINAQKGAVMSNYQRIQYFRNSSRTVIFGVIGIFLTYASLIRLDKTPPALSVHPLLPKLAQTLVAYPHIFTIIIILAYQAYAIYSERSYFGDRKEWVDLGRLMLAFSKKVAVPALVFLAFGFLYSWITFISFLKQ
jgi:hypothetical protein